MGLERLFQNLFAFGIIPRPGPRIPPETQLLRAKVIDEAMKEERKEHSKRRIAFGLRNMNLFVKGKEHNKRLRNPILWFTKIQKSGKVNISLPK